MKAYKFTNSCPSYLLRARIFSENKATLTAVLVGMKSVKVLGISHDSSKPVLPRLYLLIFPYEHYFFVYFISATYQILKIYIINNLNLTNKTCGLFYMCLHSLMNMCASIQTCHRFSRNRISFTIIYG